jgi:uncharacterized protein (UPF0147 family)
MLEVWAMTGDVLVVGSLASFAIDIVQDIFEDPVTPSKLRRAALAALKQSSPQHNWEDKLEALARTAFSGEAYNCVRIMIEDNPLASTVAFQRIVDDPSCPKERRQRVSDVLGSLKSTPLPASLTAGRTLCDIALYSDTCSLRAAALKALGHIGDPQVADDLMYMLFDKDYYIRDAVVKTLSQLGYPEWSDLLKGDHNDFYRLGKYGDKRVAKILFRAYDHNSNYRDSILSALHSLQERKLLLWEDQERLKKIEFEHNANRKSNNEMWAESEERRRSWERLEDAHREGR